MMLTYLTANDRWFFTMGDQVVTLHGQERSFATRRDAVCAASCRNLVVAARARRSDVGGRCYEVTAA